MKSLYESIIKNANIGLVGQLKSLLCDKQSKDNLKKINELWDKLELNWHSYKWQIGGYVKYMYGPEKKVHAYISKDKNQIVINNRIFINEHERDTFINKIISVLNVTIDNQTTLFTYIKL